MSVRRWYLDQALVSYKRLNEVLNELTAEEVTACLDLEAGTQRRRSVLDRLISRAVRLNEIKFNQALQEKIHGTRI
jgi:hypothetical protein